MIVGEYTGIRVALPPLAHSAARTSGGTRLASARAITRLFSWGRGSALLLLQQVPEDRKRIVCGGGPIAAAFLALIGIFRVGKARVLVIVTVHAQ